MSIFLVVLGIVVVIALVAWLDRLGTRGNRRPLWNQSNTGDAEYIPMAVMLGDDGGAAHHHDPSAPADHGFGDHGGGSDFGGDAGGGDGGGDGGGGDGGGGGD